MCDNTLIKSLNADREDATQENVRYTLSGIMQGYQHDKRTKTFAKDLAIELHYLPPYSPNLNPIERLCITNITKNFQNLLIPFSNDETRRVLRKQCAVEEPEIGVR